MDIKFIRAVIGDADLLIELQNQSFYADYIQYGYCPGYHRTKEGMIRTIETSFIYKSDAIFRASVSGCCALVVGNPGRQIKKPLFLS